MALFTIRRFCGDEESVGDGDSETRARALLQRLHQQVRARQQPGVSPAAPGEAGGPRCGPVAGAHSQTTPRKREANDQTKSSGKRRRKTEYLLNDPQERGEETDGRALNCPEEGSKAPTAEQDNVKKELLSAKKRMSVGKERKKREKEKESVDKTLDPGTESDLTDTAVKQTDSPKKNGEMADPEHQQKSAANVHQSEENSAPQPSLTILGGFKKKPIQKVQRTLPQWLSNPMLVNRDIKQHLTPIEAVPGIHPKLLRKLQGNGIHFFFPVQAEVIPMVLESAKHGLMLGRGGYRPSDICVSAPTGSGKTLAFLIPVLQALMDRAVCRIRALVVLPTKELAQQVCKVFNVYADGTGVRVVLMAGQKSFAVEQTSLVEHTIEGYRSLVDIVVATPGRLVDHIARTPGFSLQHLRYLVIDEADTMIDSMHQDWLMQVVKAVYQADANLAAGKLFRRTEPGLCTAQSSTCVQMPLQKLLFSATLTPNPEKLQQLSLYQPQLFTSTYTAPGQCRPQSQGHHSVDQMEMKYTLPEGLTEFYVPCQLNKKPLIILYFMLRMRFRRVLCFTNSREASHRLYVLIRAFGGIEVAEFSSRLSPQERRKTLKMFEQGKLQLLISTDATARGIDIKEVMCVINYDAPQFIRTYIHRVGRTARAGKAGLAFTFLLHVQEERFLQMMKDAGSKELKKQLVKHENLTPLIPRYEESLLDLKRALKDEQRKLGK
eukprot:gi/632985653/ref/XP_007909803.1/ PREDICTED: ATP-dependent RNA helicase DDX51 [Callorhinchus milii]